MAQRIKTKEDKKSDIIEFIEKKSKSGDILDLRRGNLITEFEDSHYPKGTVDDIIDELLEEGPVSESEVRLDAIHTNKHEDDLFADFDAKDEMPLKGTLILGFYTFWGLVITTDFLNRWFSNATNGQILLSSLVGIAFAIIVGKLEHRLLSRIEKKIPIIHEHKEFIYPTVAIFFLQVIIAVLALTAFSAKIVITAIVSGVGTSVLGGAAVAKYLYQRDESTTTEN